MKKKRFHWLGLVVLVVISMALVFWAGTAAAAEIKKNVAIPYSAFTPYTEDIAHSFGPLEADELPVGEFLKFEEAKHNPGDPDPTACIFAPMTFQKDSMFFRKTLIYLSENPDAQTASPWVQVQIQRTDFSEAYDTIVEKDDFMFTGGVQQFDLDMFSQNESISDKVAYQIRLCIMMEF